MLVAGDRRSLRLCPAHFMMAKDGITVAQSIASRRESALAAWRNLTSPERSRLGAYAVYLAVLTLLLIQPLVRLAFHAAHSDLHSHILLVPAISAYLLFLRLGSPAKPFNTSILGAALLGSMGVAALASRSHWLAALSFNDGLALAALAFVCLIAAGGFLFLGSHWMKTAAFPLAFLLFMVPLPDAAVDWLEKASMLASADAAAMYFRLTGTTVFREGQIFELPGIVLRVAQECSGIRSSWVLFITSLLASHVFLRTPWRRAVLVAFVIPLGILRNGFRILVIGLLCIHVGPHMIHSPIHHQGGPLFFALSLIPLSLLLWWLRRQEQQRKLPT